MHMKSTGLNQNFRRMQKQKTKAAAFSALQQNHLAAKERQKSLRLQAERAQAERQQRDGVVSSEATSETLRSVASL